MNNRRLRTLTPGPRWLPLPLLLLSAVACGGSQVVAEDANKMLTLPVRVFLYSFAAAPELDGSLRDEQVRAMFSAVNEVWAPAGIRWEIAEIGRREISADDFPEFDESIRRPEFRQRLVRSSPARSGAQPWAVAIMRKFPIPGGGVYIPETQTVFYAELNKFGESHAEILAHELGHTLGLRHVDDASNLMQGAGTEGGEASSARALSPAQVATAREQAAAGQPALGERQAPAGRPAGGKRRRRTR